MVYDGKTYRNLQDQVAYLTSMYKALGERIEEVAAQIPSKMIVEELPETGDPLVTYYVGPKGTEPNQYYEVWVWVQEEPDGPFVWRELEDTDQVDLSGYLEKQTGATTYRQAYVKAADGTQTMVNMTNDTLDGGIVVRTNAGHINLPNANDYTPGLDQAVSKRFVDGHYISKQTGVTSYNQVYAKASDGSQYMINASTSNVEGNIPVRSTGGQIFVPTSPSDYNHAACKGWIETYFVLKNTSPSTYAQAYVKNADGTQGRLDLGDAVDSNLLVRRTGAGQINVPTLPTNNAHAASKKYVDDAVGQLLYLHDLEIIVTVDATNYLYVKAYLVNGSPTAITSFGRILYKRIDVQWGAYGPDIANCEPCAVTKLPDTFRQDEFDDPFAGFLYQYISAGNLISGKTDSSMSTTITDTVISF